MPSAASSGTKQNVRAADAKEVGVGNPAEETYCCPNIRKLRHARQACQQEEAEFFGRAVVRMWSALTREAEQQKREVSKREADSTVRAPSSGGGY
jgi:hypothetical protein